ncbi:GntR family transcriptional regulator [Streptomyces lavendulocolor]|uniref:GntR family transcriptional regulator n=1 Tax=Streptomyces lavendulocolor TaxID=67316 RepID=UPI0033DB5008
MAAQPRTGVACAVQTTCRASGGLRVPDASPRGTYLLVATSLRLQVEKGLFSNGTLPSESSLTVEYGVSRNTVRRALKVLESERLITPVPGAGWRATSSASEPLIAKITALFASEGLRVGDPFPSEANLCRRFNASRTAVRRSLAQLEGSGLLNTVHGKGRTVRALPTSDKQP